MSYEASREQVVGIKLLMKNSSSSTSTVDIYCMDNFCLLRNSLEKWQNVNCLDTLYAG